MIFTDEPSQPYGAKVWDVVKWFIPTILSLAALGINLWDRRPKLTVRARKGDWYTLKKRNTTRGSELEFRGIVEVYNASSRANAVHSYRFYLKNPSGNWTAMDSERFEVLEQSATGEKENLVFNETPFTIAPYSGAEWRVMAFMRSTQQPYEAQVRVVIEDIFGKETSVVVTAVS